MSDSGKQSPLGVNVQGSILDNQGFTINPVAASYMGSSKTNSSYTFGSIVQDTVLRLQTLGINDGYLRNLLTKTNSTDTYDNLINIGSTSIPALGNSKPPTYDVSDPSGNWTTVSVAYGNQKLGYNPLPGPANTGYALTSDTDQGQEATWFPYTGVSGTNPNASVTQWGYTRLHALQAWYEFNWNGNQVDQANPEYKEFLSSFLTAESFVNNSNQNIFAMYNSKTFLEGVYSNMSDLITADVAGISLATKDFGNDLINLGNAIDLSTIDSFGLPSDMLRNLYKNNVITDDVTLALLSSGLTNTEISAILNGKLAYVSKKIQQRIYGAFLVVTDESLRNILAVLKCKTRNIDNLADLLSVRKLFPNSYQTLTVPVYNISPGPTNSKTYYLIFTNDGLNSQLTSPAITSIIGTQTLSGEPPITDTITDGTNYSEIPVGFGSYLYSIIPFAEAVAAGAFSYSLQQVRNIKYCDIVAFAQVVRSMETTTGLPLTNGTDIPVDETLADTGLSYTALGSGLYGTYTMSDLFGCMSGLPYPWKLIYERINQLQTTKLQNIYRENFLAITWEGAQVTIQYSTSVVEDPPGIFTTYYTVTGVTLTDSGGGYGRGSAPAPTITISGGSGATAICTIGTNDTDAGSNGAGTFGRVTSVTLTSPGSPSVTIPTITIEFPPTATLAVQANGSVASGGTNTASGTTGWPSPMNGVVQAYIDQANAEITAIRNNNPTLSTILNTYWNICGSQLKREQRTRCTAFPPVAIVAPDSASVVRKDYFLNLYPTTQYTFTDSLPNLAQDTKPHMTAQTLEAISNLSNVNGQSIVAFMRESRNKTRLLETGIPLDNSIPDSLSDAQVKQLTTNGVLLNPGIGPVSTTIPAWATNKDPITNETINPIPNGVFANGQFNQTNEVAFGDITSIIENQTNEVAFGDITSIIENQFNPVVSTLVPVGPQVVPGTNSNVISGTDPSSILVTDPSSILGTGPSSILRVGTSPTTDPYIIAVPIQVNPAIPPQLDTQYTSSTLLPSSPTIQEAIDKVIECNCDCWVN